MAPSNSQPEKRKNGDDKTLPPPAKRMRSSYTAPLRILVGPQKESFFAYEDVLCASSRFFKAACSKDWKENQEKTVNLPEFEPYVFRSYLDWLYHHSFDEEMLQQECGLRVGEEILAGTTICHNLFKIWLLADYIQDISCKNCILGSLLERSDAPPFSVAFRSHELLLARTSVDSSIFRWFIDWVSCFYRLEDVEDYPAALQVALLKKSAQLRDEKTWPKVPAPSDLCKYIETE